MTQLVHFVSTGQRFPYMYYIGVMTALKVYGDKVRLWITEEPQNGYFEALKGKVKINKIASKDIPDFPALEGRDDHFKRTAMFDYLIWNIVYEHGGMIMGLDSLTLKPHFDLLEDGKELLAPRDVESNPNSFAMHGVIVRKGSELARLIISDAWMSLNSLDMKWGDPGIRPFMNNVLRNLDKISTAQPGLCAGYNTSGLHVFRNDVIQHPDVRTIPLYARATKMFNVVLDEEYIAVAESYYARVVKRMLSEEEWNGKRI